ncbi:nitrite reductase small subunit NirD [Corynebacterium guangdongense]|uniref:Nitrite reductase (NADH) small subunit n=1 Tax=Corynebacterium guangdongense TaxID=1783348 RepID=A0ABU1ZUC0_9CORY|nr:nitrite reductase small subunit NirD [Corynebacterium guangdongense]MDR7328521.1 nitrite reductase (NADH) small subunit [Corynebacterium guangdongense]WJZ17098.1 Nitrite reductase (NADH) small subunit [Corynebacterium guangdongense]
MSETTVCRLDQLTLNLGVAALLPGGRQVALFRVPAVDGETLHAVDNIDPYTGASVISRGIVGEVDGRPTIASPLLKQKFYLDDGQSLQGDEKSITVYDTRVVDGEVIVSS